MYYLNKGYQWLTGNSNQNNNNNQQRPISAAASSSSSSSREVRQEGSASTSRSSSSSVSSQQNVAEMNSQGSSSSRSPQFRRRSQSNNIPQGENPLLYRTLTAQDIREIETQSREESKVENLRKLFSTTKREISQIQEKHTEFKLNLLVFLEKGLNKLKNKAELSNNEKFTNLREEIERYLSETKLEIAMYRSIHENEEPQVIETEESSRESEEKSSEEGIDLEASIELIEEKENSEEENTNNNTNNNSLGITIIGYEVKTNNVGNNAILEFVDISGMMSTKLELIQKKVKAFNQQRNVIEEIQKLINEGDLKNVKLFGLYLRVSDLIATTNDQQFKKELKALKEKILPFLVYKLDELSGYGVSIKERAELIKNYLEKAAKHEGREALLKNLEKINAYICEVANYKGLEHVLGKKEADEIYQAIYNAADTLMIARIAEENIPTILLGMNEDITNKLNNNN